MRIVHTRGNRNAERRGGCLRLKLLSSASAMTLLLGASAFAQSVSTSGQVSPVQPDNPSASWTIGNPGQLTIGDGAAGSLSVTGGGEVEVDTVAPTRVGRDADGDGSLVISGAGSQVRLLDGGLELGFADGKGEITVTDGGHLRVDGEYIITKIPNGGPLGGDLTQITRNDALAIGKDGGTATLNVTNGGTVRTGLLTISDHSNDSSYGMPSASILIDGEGSSVAVNENLELLLGGAITVSGGAQLRTFTDSAFAADPYKSTIAPDRLYGRASKETVVTVTGTDSAWHSGNTIRAESRVSLTVEDGARVSAAEAIRIGFGRDTSIDGPSVSLLVDDAALKAGSVLYIADGGAWAKASFINGAAIETRGVMAGAGGTRSGDAQYDAQAEILVSGAGTAWKDARIPAFGFYLGDSGLTKMTVTDRATIDTANRAVFGWGTYTSGQADVLVSDGARFSTTSSLTLGEGANARGTLTVDGAGSSVKIGKAFKVGDEGKGEVTVRNGGLIDAGGATALGGASGSEGRMTVADEGQVFTSRIAMGRSDGSASGFLTIGEGSASAWVDASRLDLRSGELRLGDGGVLDLDGGPANIGARGIVSGTGVIGGNLALNGRAAPGHAGIGTLTVNGDVSFNAGSVYSVDLQAPDRSDRIEATGTALVNGGGLEIVKLSDEDSYTGGQTYRIVSAKTVDMREELVFEQPFSLLRTDLVYATDGIDLTLTADIPFTTLAATFNQFQTAAGLQALEQSGDALLVYNTLVGLSLQPGGDQAARRAFDLSSGEVHASAQHAADGTFSLFNHALRYQGVAGAGRTGPETAAAPLGYGPVTRNGAAAAIGEATAGGNARTHGAWAAPLGGFGHIDGNGNAGSLEWWSAGLAGGYEGALDAASGNAVAGFGFGYIHSHGNVDARLSSFDSDGFYLGAYGAWSDGPWNVAGALSYGANRISTERSIAFLGRTAEADYWAHSVGLSGEASYGFDLAETTRIAPLFTLDAGWSGHGSFTERGAGALNLTSASESWGRFDTGLGIALTHVIPAENGPVTLEGRAVWEHAFADTLPSQSLTLAGSPAGFTVHGPEAARNRLRLGAGVSWSISDKTSLRARYDGLFASDQNTHAASFGINVKF